ncbi:MAG: hypothetical protein ABI315_10815 [Bacteroidia bacterium]
MQKTFSLTFFITCVGILSSICCYSQPSLDTLTLLTGKVIIGTIKNSIGDAIVVSHLKKPNSSFVIENDRIFSINSNKNEKLFYSKDTSQGNDFTIEEMRYYIYGEQQALKTVKSNGFLATNMIIGIAGGITGSFLSPIPVFVFMTLTGLPKVKLKTKNIVNPAYVEQPTYVMGYKAVVRKKRKVQSLIGGGIGLGVGLGSFFILNSMGYKIIK